VLEALIEADPENKLITKIVKGLLNHRRKGHWGNTQENCWSCWLWIDTSIPSRNIPLNLFQEFWLGEGFAGESEFKGRTTDSHLLEIPMKVLLRSFVGEENCKIL